MNELVWWFDVSAGYTCIMTHKCWKYFTRKYFLFVLKIWARYKISPSGQSSRALQRKERLQIFWPKSDIFKDTWKCDRKYAGPKNVENFTLENVRHGILEAAYNPKCFLGLLVRNLLYLLLLYYLLSSWEIKTEHLV